MLVHPLAWYVFNRRDEFGIVGRDPNRDGAVRIPLRPDANVKRNDFICLGHAAFYAAGVRAATISSMDFQLQSTPQIVSVDFHATKRKRFGNIRG